MYGTTTVLVGITTLSTIYGTTSSVSGSPKTIKKRELEKTR
jgi:hypothetical protein